MTIQRLATLAAATAATALFLPSAAASPTAVYSNIPDTLAGNYPSLGYQATSTQEFGDRITLDGDARLLRSATITMSSWAKSEDWGNAVSFQHPITLNIYEAGTGLLPGPLITSITQDATIPYRPTGWGFNGIAFNLTFDFSSLNVVLPDEIAVGVAYNTETHGYTPIGVPGPYNSLNFGLNDAPGGGITVGSNPDLDDVLWNTSFANFYTDGGAAGVGIFRRDTNWAPYVPMIEINTASTLRLEPQDDCLDDAESQLVVDLVFSGSDQVIQGGQFLLAYDNSLLDLVSADPGDAPFTQEVFEDVDAGAGTIAYATGVAFGSPGTDGETVMARLTFDIIGDAEFCSTADLVTFRAPGPGEQPTRLTDDQAQAILPSTSDLPAVQSDNTPPALSIPADISVNADAGHCDALLDPGSATALDNCTDATDIAITGVRSDTLPLLDPYPAGVTTITWTATDACGNETVADQTVTVAPSNTLVAPVELVGLESVITLDGDIQPAEWAGFSNGAAGVDCGAIAWDSSPDWVAGTLGPYVYTDAGVSITATVIDADSVSLPTQPTDDNTFGVPSLWFAGSFMGSPSAEIVLELQFDQPVYDVSTTLYDVDSKNSVPDIAEVHGTLGAGPPLPLSGVVTGSGVDWDGATTFTANGTSNGNPPTSMTPPPSPSPGPSTPSASPTPATRTTSASSSAPSTSLSVPTPTATPPTSTPPGATTGCTWRSIRRTRRTAARWTTRTR